MSPHWSKFTTASPKLCAVAGRSAVFSEEVPILFSFLSSFCFKVAPFTTNCITKLFKVWGFLWFFGFFFLFLIPLVPSSLCLTDHSWWNPVLRRLLVGQGWGYRAKEGFALCRNGANGIMLRTAAGTSGVKLPLFKLYDARDCQLSHLQHINYVNCSCTFFNPDFSWIMDDGQGQNLLLVFPCDSVCAECTEQS